MSISSLDSAQRGWTPAVATLLLLALCPTPAIGEGFVDVTAEAGVAYVQQVPREAPNCLLFGGLFCEAERMTGGVAVGDYDGDGRDDLYLTRVDGHDLLLRNTGGAFEDRTAEAGLQTIALQSNGAHWLDIDNDRDLDLFVSTLGDSRYHLFVNDGAGGFTEEAVARGAAVESSEPHLGYGIAAGDFDRDGWVDLFVGEWGPGFLDDDGVSHSRLLRNRGADAPGHFEDVTASAGVQLELSSVGASWAFAPAFVDLDGDLYPELAIAADFGTSTLFENLRDGGFAERTETAGIGSDENGMGSTFGDIDGDGDLDWFVTSIFDPDETCETVSCSWGYTGNRLYLNDGGLSFTDATDTAGVRDGGWGWGTAFFDSDNDGDLDLVMTNGVDFPDGDIPGADAPFETDVMRFWKNDGTGRMTEQAAAAGLSDTGPGKGLATLDYDGDGDLDIILVNTVGGAKLYRNDGGNDGDWLRIRLQGVESNTRGLGARVRIRTTSSDPWMLRQMGVGSHFMGQSEAVAHFGLGTAIASIATVEIRWPSGIRQVLHDVASNQTLTVTERRSACGVGGLELALALAFIVRRSRG